MNTAIDVACHCGAVHLRIEDSPDVLTECNCSICSRYGALWAYYPPQDVRVVPAKGATHTYVWGDRTIAFHHCVVCGCLTHWSALGPSARMGVNARLMDPDLLRSLRIRKRDGAGTGKYFR